jgi:hypothetical protein
MSTIPEKYHHPTEENYICIREDIINTRNLSHDREKNIQGAAERTPQFGYGIARGSLGTEQWGGARYIAVFMPFSTNTMAWSDEHSAFVVEELIQNGGSPIMTQRAFCNPFWLGRYDPVPDKKKFTIGFRTSDKQIMR